MKLEVLPYDLTMCMVEKIEDIGPNGTFTYVSRATEGHEVLCVTDEAPANTIIQADGWKGIVIRSLPESQRDDAVEKLSQALDASGITNRCEKMCEFDVILVDAKSLEAAVSILATYG